MKRKKSFRRSYRRKPIVPLHKKRGFWIAVFLPIIISTLVLFLFFHPIFWIDEIRLFGDEDLDREMIMKIIEEESVFRIGPFESKTIFLARTSEMTDRILKELPKIESVQIKRSFPDSLRVTIRERKAVAIWCRDENDCYLISADGVIFKETPIIVEMAVIRGGDSAASLAEAPISRENMLFLVRILDEVKDLVKIVEFEIEGSEVIARTDEGWDIYFTLRESALVQAERLILVIKEGIFNQDRARLDYVDVRFEDRVYFKHEDK